MFTTWGLSWHLAASHVELQRACAATIALSRIFRTGSCRAGGPALPSFPLSTQLSYDEVLSLYSQSLCMHSNWQYPWQTPAWVSAHVSSLLCYGATLNG